MKKIIQLLCMIVLWTIPVIAQIPDGNRLTDWSKSGMQNPLPSYQQIQFTGDPSGLNDNSLLLKQIFDTLTMPTLILFDSGKFLFNQTIVLPDRTVLKGLGNNQTELMINLGGTHAPGIQIRGSEITTNYPLTADAEKNKSFIKIQANQTSLFQNGDCLRLISDDEDLAFEGFAAQRLGQIVTIASIKGDTLFLEAPLRRDFTLTKKARFRKIQPKRFCGLMCMRIERLDNSNSGIGSANIEIRNVTDCFIKAVESVKCNFAHIEGYQAYQTTIENNYFHDAQSFGSGGRGYGVMLHFTSGQVLVQNNVFRRLRHAMILQVGANGNVFAYNYAFEGRKEIFTNFFVVGEDLVCHGNYPYLNLFEGNYAQFASVDNSHGANGPFNTFFRNISTTQGFQVTSPNSFNQNFTGNHRIAGNVSFSSSGHHITDNSWQGASGLTHPTLFYNETPQFLQGYGLGQIGPPSFSASVSIPARDRTTAGTPITDLCDIIIWENGSWQTLVRPNESTGNYRLLVKQGPALQINRNLNLKSIEIDPNAQLVTQPGVLIRVKK
jgi:hypothetical protein